MVHKKWLRALLCGYILFCAVACTGVSPSPQQTAATSTGSTSTAAAQPTTPSLPPGTVLFQANWAHGLAQWQVSGNWKIVLGQLEGESDTSEPATIIIPYRPVVPNYAIEIRMQIVRLPHEGGDWDIFAKRQSGKDGFQAEVFSLLGSEPRPFGEHPTISVMIDPLDTTSPSSASVNDYEPGFTWHMYRVEVQDNQARLLDNGVLAGEASSNNTVTLSDGPLGLSITDVELRVSSIRVLSL